MKKNEALEIDEKIKKLKYEIRLRDQSIINLIEANGRLEDACLHLIAVISARVMENTTHYDALIEELGI